MSRSVSSLLLESFPILYKTTVDTIKTIFDSDEFEAIFDYIKVNFVKINSSSSVFQHVIYDDLQLNIICKDNIADKYGFLEKLKSLHFFELFILELWIHTFWYHKDSTNDFEEYISKDYDFPKL
ncbi:MAG: hypothetical protein JSU85_08670 [Candidatus Zixiibacteriota bacterium]|nr:MAG: hypothetical protein JSU85_08670 [candidate division Zixibacteria bacterium]